jgi:hypothetical protein
LATLFEKGDNMPAFLHFSQFGAKEWNWLPFDTSVSFEQRREIGFLLILQSVLSKGGKLASFWYFSQFWEKEANWVPFNISVSLIKEDNWLLFTLQTVLRKGGELASYLHLNLFVKGDNWLLFYICAVYVLIMSCWYCLVNIK